MELTEKQVYQWFIEKLTGTISPEDEVALTSVLLANPYFRSRWDSWTAEARGMDIPTFIHGLDAEAGLKSLKDRIGARHNVRRLPNLKKIVAAASIFLIGLTASYYTWFRHGSEFDKKKIAALIQNKKPAVSLTLGNGRSVDLSQGNNDKPIRLANATLNTGGESLRYSSGDTTQNVLSVPPGSKYNLTLSDGTEVILNAATTLRFPFRFPGNSREVYVEGEAYFSVARDANRPFIVHTPLTRVQVLGTSFDVNTYVQGKVRTALVEGKVLTVSNHGETTALDPGKAADYDTAKGFVTSRFDTEDELSWISGIYYFHDMPIAGLAKLASRCYGVHIIVNGDSGRSVTGMLEKGKLLEFLNDLETTAHIKCHYSGNDLYFE